jgi:hypothetical protein
VEFSRAVEDQKTSRLDSWYNPSARLKQDTFNKRSHVFWFNSVPSSDNYKFTFKPRFQWKAHNVLLPMIEREGMDGDERDAHPDRDEVDDQIEIIELHKIGVSLFWQTSPSRVSCQRAWLI